MTSETISEMTPATLPLTGAELAPLVQVAATATGCTINGVIFSVGTVTSGAFAIGQSLSGPSVVAGTSITGGSGSTWTVSVSQTVASTTISGSTNVNAPVSLLGGAVTVSSPDNSITASVATGNALSIALAAVLKSAVNNIVPGTFTLATLPAASLYPNCYASVSGTGAGPYYSDGSSWLQLYNLTSGALKISTGTPLPAGANGTAYSVTLTATGGVGAVTWSEVSQYAVTGTANTFTVNSAGVLACASPTNNSTTAIVVQVVDSTGAVSQKTLTVTVVASLTPAATPTFSPAAGLYSGTQTVTISCSTPSPTIYYTTNGATPTLASSVYAAPLSISAATTVKAIAIASGFTQSAVGSAAYTFNAANANPIGGLIAGGGTGTGFNYEGFPIFKNRIREGYCTNTTWDSGGNPTGISVNIVLWEPLSGGSQPSWLTAATSSTPMKCGFVTPDTGTLTVTGSGCTIANFVQGAANAYSYFDLYVTSTQTGGVAYTIGGLTTGTHSNFANLAEYPSTTVDDPTNPSAITNEVAALWASCNHAQLEWPSISMWDTQQGTSTTRKTPSNTQMQFSGQMGQHNNSTTLFTSMASGLGTLNLPTWTQGPGTFMFVFGTSGYVYTAYIGTVGSGTANVSVALDTPLATTYTYASYGVEGRPTEWYLALAIAANTGLWVCLPYFEDGTSGAAGSYCTAVFNLIATARTNYPAWTGNIYIKFGNENWNSTYYTYYMQQKLYAKYGYASAYTYMAYKFHTIAQIGRSVFGAAWNVSVLQVFDWQVRSSFGFYEVLTAMVAAGYTPSADLAYIADAPYGANAPYATAIVTATSGTGGAQPTVAQIQAACTAMAVNNALICNAENTAIQGWHYGIPKASYESNPNWIGVSGVTNLSAAINDPGYQACLTAYLQGLFNSGYELLSHSVIGTSAAPSTGNSSLELGDNYATQVSTGSPAWLALQSFAGGFTPTRNVISGSGSVILGGNYADQSGAANPGFPVGRDLQTNGSPYYPLQGYIGYMFYSTKVQTLSLTLTMAGTGTPETNVEIGGPGVSGGFAIQYTNVPLAAGANVIGNVTLPEGFGYILFGKGSAQSTLTIAQMSFN